MLGDVFEPIPLNPKKKKVLVEHYASHPFEPLQRINEGLFDFKLYNKRVMGYVNTVPAINN